MTPKLRMAPCAAAILCAWLAPGIVLAQPSRTASPESLFRDECGGCHVPYPPRLLPAADWKALMATLDRHFGDDASLDARTAADIGRFLESHAGARRSSASAGGLPRITRTRWFAREHREVSQRAWSLPQVKSPANCGACHPGAANGDFEEDDVAVPR